MACRLPAAAHRRRNRCAASDHAPARTATAAPAARDSTAGCAARSRNLLHLRMTRESSAQTGHDDGGSEQSTGRVKRGRDMVCSRQRRRGEVGGAPSARRERSEHGEDEVVGEAVERVYAAVTERDAQLRCCYC